MDVDVIILLSILIQEGSRLTLYYPTLKSHTSTILMVLSEAEEFRSKMHVQTSLTYFQRQHDDGRLEIAVVTDFTGPRMVVQQSNFSP